MTTRSFIYWKISFVNTKNKSGISYHTQTSPLGNCWKHRHGRVRAFDSQK